MGGNQEIDARDACREGMYGKEFGLALRKVSPLSMAPGRQPLNPSNFPSDRNVCYSQWPSQPHLIVYANEVLTVDLSGHVTSARPEHCRAGH